MTPPTAKARATDPGLATTQKIPTTTTQQDRSQPTRLDRTAVVFAVLLRAVAGATFDRLLVRTCCWCRFAHVHHVPVGSDLGALVRSPRCAPHRRYRLEIVDVVPPAAAAGLRRRAS